MDQISCGIWGCWPIPNGSSTPTSTVAPLVLNDTTVEGSAAGFNVPEADIINILVAVVLLVEVCIVVALLILLKQSEGIAKEEFSSSWLVKINDIQPEGKNEDEPTESEDQERLIQWIDEQDGEVVLEQSDLEAIQPSDDQELRVQAEPDQLVQSDNNHKVQICDQLYDEK